jgi:hypothetical protein
MDPDVPAESDEPTDVSRIGRWAQREMAAAKAQHPAGEQQPASQAPATDLSIDEPRPERS